jgi:membrane-associated protease RseP (regulator of RpoE activity)
MTTIRTWQRASLLIALSLVTAAATAFAASGKPDEPTQSITYLFNPGHESWLGLMVKDTNEAQAKELKLPHVTGVLVVSVIAGSPAEKAGFKPNDVILEFDGQRVRSVAQLHRLIEETPSDRTVRVEIIRQGKLQTLQAKIENRGPGALLQTPDNPNFEVWIGPEFELPQSPEPGQPPEPGPEWKVIPLPPVMPKFYLGPLPNLKPEPLPQPKPFVEPGPKGETPSPPVMPKFYPGPLPNLKPQPLPQPKPFIEPGPKGETPLPPSTPFNTPFSTKENELGITGDNLTPQLARYFGVKQGKGVLVSRVVPGSPASAAGLKAGDVIVRVGSQRVGSMAELRLALQTHADKQHKITLGIVRDRKEWEMSVLLAPGSHGPKLEPIMALQSQ